MLIELKYKFRSTLLVCLCLHLCGCTIKNTIHNILNDKSFINEASFLNETDEKLQYIESAPSKFVNYIIAPEQDYKIQSNKFASFAVHNSPINTITTTSDDKASFSGDTDGNIFFNVLNINNDKLTLSSRKIIKLNFPVNFLSVSPDEKFLAVAIPQNVLILDLEKKQIVAELTNIKGKITTLAWGENNEYLAIGQIGKISIWKVIDRNNNYSFVADSISNIDALENYNEGLAPIIGIYFSDNNKIFFAAEQNGTIIVRNLFSTEQELGIWTSNEAGYVNKVETKHVHLKTRIPILGFQMNTNNSKEFITAHNNGVVLWWKFAGLLPTQILNLGNKIINHIAISNNNTIITSTNENIVYVWKNIDFQARSNSDFQVKIDPQTRGKIPAINLDKKFREINKSNALLFRSPIFDESITGIQSSPTGDFAWIIQHNGRITLIDVK